MKKSFSRRRFLTHITLTSLGFSLLPPTQTFASTLAQKLSLPFNPIQPSEEDFLIFPSKIIYTILFQEGETLANQDKIWANHSGIGFLPVLKGSNEGYLWINFEKPNAWKRPTNIEELQPTLIEKEMKQTGGVLLPLKNSGNGWEFKKDENKGSFAINAFSEVSFAPNNTVIDGYPKAMGLVGAKTVSITPWRTILVSEHNSEELWDKQLYAWELAYTPPLRHYGWVTQLLPNEQSAQKLVTLGRCNHAGLDFSADGSVLYFVDAQPNGCLYKYILRTAQSFDEGQLFVANLTQNRWELIAEQNKASIPLATLHQTALEKGGTPLPYPQDLKIDPISHNIFIANKGNGQGEYPMGNLLRIREEKANHKATSFTQEIFLKGGEHFAAPAFLLFDHQNNLWLATAMSINEMKQSAYKKFKNNGIFYVPMQGIDQGEIFQVGSAPIDAYFSAMALAPDRKAMFLSLQPQAEWGKNNKDMKPKSHFPEGNESLPKSLIIVLAGEAIEKLFT